MVPMPTTDKHCEGRYRQAMNESSNRETLDGLLDAVAAADGAVRPEWVDAYAWLLSEAILDRHHIGLLVGFIRRSPSDVEQHWSQALAKHDDHPQQRWTLQALSALALKAPLPPLTHAPCDAFMQRLSHEIEAFRLEEEGHIDEAMEVRRSAFYGWTKDDTEEHILLGFDLFDDFLSLERNKEAQSLLSELDAMIDYVGHPLLQAELLDREADMAREAHDYERAMRCYERASECLSESRSVHLRLSYDTMRVNQLLQKGLLNQARERLEQDIKDPSHPFVLRAEQRRLTSLCQLYTTLEDKRALYETLETLIERVIEAGWALFGTLSSHLDDLINLACQFGEGKRAKEILARGEALLKAKNNADWLNVARIRIALWDRQEGEIPSALTKALDSSLMTRDLFFCQTLINLVDEYGDEVHKERIEGALERCFASLSERNLMVRASNALHYKAHAHSQAGREEAARETFRESVRILKDAGHYGARVTDAAMDWATWEINGGHLHKLEEPIEIVVAHSDDQATPALMARLSFQQAMYFAMNSGRAESEEDPKAIVGRWIALAADQYLEANRVAEANSVYMQLADWLDSQGEYQAATEILESVAQGAMSAGDIEVIWQAALVAANRLDQEGDGPSALELLGATLESCESEETSARGAQHFEYANLLNSNGHHEEAHKHYLLAHEGLSDGSVQDRARILVGLGQSLWHGGDEKGAVRHWQDALVLAHRSAERDFICDLALTIDNQLLERLDLVGSQRVAWLEDLVRHAESCRWDLIANGSDLPLRLAEEYAHSDIESEHVEVTIQALKNIADAVTRVGMPYDATLLLQRAAGIELLRGNHDTGLTLMREVLDRVETNAGTIVRGRECLLQATMVAAGGLVHEAWDRVSEVRDWLATIEEDQEDERALDELTLTCQLQCANLHMLGDKAELVIAPLTELIATCDVSEDGWPAAQLARVTLAAAHTTLGNAAKATELLGALNQHLEQGTSGWFNGVIIAGRLGQRALGEALIRGIQDSYGQGPASRWSSTDISVRCGSDWLAFTSGELVDTRHTEAMAKRALATRHFSLATLLTLLRACYAMDADEVEEARKAVAEAVEIARRHWALDEFGIMWGVLLPTELKQLAGALLEADRLQHLN